jgi:serine/threonine-protein kinase
MIGQHELRDRPGRGGWAAVYRALQPSLGRQVAIKVLPLGQLPDPSLPERFRREARMAANLMHPNIVPVYDFGEWQGHLFIVMALIAGGTLKERLGGPMPVEAAVRLVG